MKRKISKIFGVGLALVLVLSLSLVAAAPVAASPDVSNVWVDLDDYTATNSAKYSIYFTPGADLTADTDTINIIFPSGTNAASATATVDPDGDLLTEDATAAEESVSATRAAVTTPVDLSAGVQVRLDISNVTNPADGEQTLDIYTSQELTKVSSDTYTIGATSVTSVDIAPDSGVAGATEEYVVSFTATTDLGTPWGKVTVIFPPEVTLPASMLASDVKFDKDNGASYIVCTVAPTISGRFVTITVSETASASDNCKVQFLQSAGIQNPTEVVDGANTYVGKVYTTTDAGIVDDAGFDVVAAAIAKLAFVTANSKALAEVNTAADLEVQTQDQYGNAKTVSDDDKIISVTSTSGTGQFSGDGGTNWGVTTDDIVIGQSETAGLQYKDSTAGSYTITADEAPSAGWASATWDITVEAAHSVSLYDENGVLIDDTYTTIAEAISDAAAGDTIKVEPGTYAENLNISVPDLALESTGGAASTTIEGGMTLSAAANDFVLGGAEGKGFTLQGSDTLVLNDSGASDVTISYNTFDLTDDTASKGILIETDDCSGWMVTENAFTITDIQDQGIYGSMTSTISGLTVTNNTFTGTDNTLETSSMEICSPDITSVSTIISGNIMTATEKGVVIGRDQAAAGLVTTGTATGTLTISSNTFDGLKWGLEIINAHADADDDQDLVVVRNTFSNNEYAFTIDYGKYIMGTDYLEPEDFTVQYNDFSGNTYAVYNASTAMTAINNYWGDVTGPSTDPDAPTPTAYGAGDPISADVTYSPWLSKSQSECVTASFPVLTVDLSVGWNTLSAPAKLLTTVDAVDELVPTGLDLAYWYDAFNEGGPIWRSAVTHQLLPCDAVYIKMVSTQTVLFQIDGADTYVPSKDLAAGWNMIGLASLVNMDATNAVASVADSFAQVVSPSMNSAAWVEVALQDPAEDEMLVGEGYWIFMKSEATLGGFVLCPIVPQY